MRAAPEASALCLRSTGVFLPAYATAPPAPRSLPKTSATAPRLAPRCTTARGLCAQSPALESSPEARLAQPVTRPIGKATLVTLEARRARVQRHVGRSTEF